MYFVGYSPKTVEEEREIVRQKSKKRQLNYITFPAATEIKRYIHKHGLAAYGKIGYLVTYDNE